MQLRIVIFLFTFSFAIQAFSDEQVLCDVSSDIDSDTGKIVVEMDQDNRSIDRLYQDSYHAGKLSARIELKADKLREGIILNKKDKHIIVRMRSDNFDTERGGVLYLDTLYSGVSGQRKEYVMELAMDKNGPVLIHEKKDFKRMKFIAKRSKVLGVIGIEKVDFGN